jgi:hypothetical protein
MEKMVSENFSLANENKSNSSKEQVLVFANEENVFSNKSSLQDNFKQFLQMRKDLRKSKSIESQNRACPSWKDNPERMQKLREKFVNRAISYLGIPYGKRYLTEDHPLYNSPIFLDCCGLVRQCVNDLKEDFGFMLGRWNQAYQFDVLDKECISNLSELKPGDLIFYTATFYKEKGWKSQPHDMVHVEIYLGGEGTPERTIASRDRFGVVEYNETYQFTSENYYDIRYHFKSINPWLRGIHKSFCDEHQWHDKLMDYNPNKFSLFSTQTDENGNEFAEQMEKEN